MENKEQNPLKKFLRNFGLRQEINFFIENLTSLMSSGMGVISALDSILEEINSARMKKIISNIQEEIKNGSSLSGAIGKADIISFHTLSLIRLGEKSGRLIQNLQVAVLQNEKDMLFRSRIRSSLMYAVIIFTLAVVVGVGTAWFTLPKLAIFFNEIDAELPLVTKILISAGTFLSDYGILFVPMFIIFILTAFYFLFSFPKTKFIGHTILFKLPVIKKLIGQVEVARFSFLLGTMLKAGMPAIESLKAMPKTTTFNNYKKFYIFLGEKVEEGNSFKKCFSLYPNSHKLFPASMRQMISAAEQSGNLPETLLRIGQMFEQKTEATARNLPVILEPILLVLIGIMVAILALGTILPIYNLSNLI